MIRGRIFAVFGYLIPFVQLMLCFVAIKVLHSSEGNILRACIFICPYICILSLTLVAFSVAGNSIRFSEKWICGYKGRSNSATRKRVCRSLPPLKVQFGNNFVEPLTPLVVQEFCIRQTTSLLLMSK